MKKTYHYFRIILCALVFINLWMNNAVAEMSALQTLVINLLDCCQWLFFMLSGALLLREKDMQYVPFYLKRAKRILPEFLAASLFALILQIGFSVSFGFAKDYIKGILTGSITSAHQFVYEMLAVYLIMPFLAIMMKNLTQQEKRILAFVLIGYFAVFSICVICNLKLGFADYPFLNGLTFVLMGTIIEQAEWPEHKIKKLLVISAAALIVSCIESICFADVNWALNSFCVSRLLMCMGIFLLVKIMAEREENDIKIGENKTEKCKTEESNKRAGSLLLKYMARETYAVALIMPICIGRFENNLGVTLLVGLGISLVMESIILLLEYGIKILFISWKGGLIKG